jgi:hypothetical protein
VSHNAIYELCIEKANKMILEMTLKFLEKENLIKFVNSISDYYGNYRKAYGFGVKSTAIGHKNYGVSITISNEGKIEISGENMDYCMTAEFQKMLEQCYYMVARRYVMAKFGYKTEMRMVERNGRKVVQVAGVTE